MNKEVWLENLVNFQDSLKKRTIVLLEKKTLEIKNRIPLKIKVMCRYIFLREFIKKKEHMKIIVNELINLWEKKLNFPHTSYQDVCQNFDQILKTYCECSRRGRYESLNVVLDNKRKW